MLEDPWLTGREPQPSEAVFELAALDTTSEVRDANHALAVNVT